MKAVIMSLYSIKMRASQKIKDKNIHISGAEKIIDKSNIKICTDSLIKRALAHENGEADFINIKIENIKKEDVIELQALPVINEPAATKEEGFTILKNYLDDLGIKKSSEILKLIKKCANIRGAILLNINTFERMEPDFTRGIRATYMDSKKFALCSKKNHFSEAIILATKVSNAPNIVGEICISDDKNYVTGYFASKKTGYIRISKLKEKGDPIGGRIFLYNGKTKKDLSETIYFIEKQPVIVKNVESYSDINSKWKQFEDDIKNLKTANLYRTQDVVTENNNSNIVIDDKNYFMFSSNNYLGLANNPKVKKYASSILKKYGTGTGGSRLICGNFDLHKKLEEKIAKFKKCESAILFNSGYCTNLSVIPALFKEDYVIFSDELNHASIIDGCKLSKAKTIIFKHADYKDLEEKINGISFKNGVIISDAVFSMDGDIADLPQILSLAEKYNLFTYIDEAHSTGVLGQKGRGITEYYNLKKHPDILMGTLSKAIGSEGGYVAGSKLLTDYLRNFARGYIFSTSLSPSTVAAAYKSLDLLEHDNSYINKLHENIEYFNTCLNKAKIKVHSQTPIFSFIIGDEKLALETADKLMNKNFYIKAIRYPTVPKGQARLRVVLSSETNKKPIKQLISVLKEIIL